MCITWFGGSLFLEGPYYRNFTVVSKNLLLLCCVGGGVEANIQLVWFGAFRRSDEGLARETLALESLYRDQITFNLVEIYNCW